MPSMFAQRPYAQCRYNHVQNDVWNIRLAISMETLEMDSSRTGIPICNIICNGKTEFIIFINSMFSNHRRFSKCS